MKNENKDVVEKKTHIVSLKLSDSEYASLCDAAKINHCSKSQAIRMAIINFKEKKRI